MTEEIREKIADAQMVLVGIGKEMEEKCTLVTVEMYNNRPKWIKFKEGICRLVSPLL